MKEINYFDDDFNAVLATDSYKISHQIMMPPGLEYLESYGESRGGEYQHTTVVGYTPILRMIQGVQITQEKINEAKYLSAYHFGSDKIFDPTIWEYIMEKYDGHLPIKIYAVPEGSVVATKNIIFKTVPLEPKFADLASYIETMFMRVW